MFNSNVGIKIRNKMRKFEKDKENLTNILNEITKSSYKKVKSGTLSNKVYPGILEESFIEMNNMIKSKIYSSTYNMLPYFTYGSINLNSSFKPLVYFKMTESIYIKGISRLYKFNYNLTTNKIIKNNIYELQDVAWTKIDPSMNSSLEQDLSLNTEQQNFVTSAKLILLLLIEIKKNNTEIDQTIISKNLSDYLFNTNERILTLGIEKINLDKNIRIGSDNNSTKKPIYVIDEYDFICS